MSNKKPAALNIMENPATNVAEIKCKKYNVLEENPVFAQDFKDEKGLL